MVGPLPGPCLQVCRCLVALGLCFRLGSPPPLYPGSSPLKPAIIQAYLSSASALCHQYLSLLFAVTPFGSLHPGTPFPSPLPLPYLVISKIMTPSAMPDQCGLSKSRWWPPSRLSPLLAGSILTPLWLSLWFTAKGASPCALQVTLPLPIPPSWAHVGSTSGPFSSTSALGPHKSLWAV